MQNTREKILRSAGELFSEKGYSTISMREIASACGVSKPAIYHYFQGKESLYREVLQQELERLVAALSEAASPPGTIVTRLSAVVRCYLGMLNQRMSLIQLILRDIGVVESEIRIVIDQGRESFLLPVVSLLEEGIRTGEIRPVDPMLAALSLIGMMNVFVMRSTLEPGATIGDDEQLHTVDILLNGLLPRG